jgi:hypothetical protein
VEIGSTRSGRLSARRSEKFAVRISSKYLGLGEAEMLTREIEALLKADCTSFSSVEYCDPLLEQCGLQQHLETVLEMKEDGRLPPIIVDTVECGRRSPQR